MNIREFEDETPKKDITVVRLPHSICFSILQIPLVAPWWPTTWIDSYNATVLTRFLLIEAWLAGSDSAFAPYLASLPPPTEDRPFLTPLYWDQGELATLNGTNLGRATRSRVEKWTDEFESGKTLLVQLCDDRKHHIDQYSFRLYRWAATVLTSRCFPGRLITPTAGHAATVESRLDCNFSNSKMYEEWLEKREGFPFPVLLPVLDLANHNPEVNALWQSTSDSVELITSVPNSMHLEICNNYGAKSSEELILGYGFDLSDNRADHVALALNLSAQDSPKLKLAAKARDEAIANESGTEATPLFRPNSLESGPQIYALREGIDPVSSPAATPLAFLLMSTRDLMRQCKHPVQNPGPFGNKFPSRLGVALVTQFAAKLSQLYAELEANGPTWNESILQSSRPMQMAKRYRTNQAHILMTGIDICTTTTRKWNKSGRILTLNDLLTRALPETALKDFRQICHRAFGTRNSAKILRKGFAHHAFILWLLVAIKMLDSDNAQAKNDTAEAGTFRYESFTEYFEKLYEGYGRPWVSQDDQTQPYLDAARKACWTEKGELDLEESVRNCERLLAETHALDGRGFEEFKIKRSGREHSMPLSSVLRWTARVVAEETILVEAKALLNEENNDSEEYDDETLETVLVFEDGTD